MLLKSESWLAQFDEYNRVHRGYGFGIWNDDSHSIVDCADDPNVTMHMFNKQQSWVIDKTKSN